MTVRDSPDSAEHDGGLELVALARLGLAVQVPADDAGPHAGEALLDWLVRLGRIKPHQALAVKGLVQRGAVQCSCGERSLAPDAGEAFRCTACGAALVKQSTGGWTPKRARKVPGKGDTIGPLELLEVLGKGAYGTVYRARHVQVGRLSAVKVLGSSALDPRTRKRFEREVEALARLRHPGIVSVHSAFEHEGTLVCEMDLVAGEDLEARVHRLGPLPWREAVRICRVIASAVEHAHQQGVVHRDLKPANILIRESDQAPLVADFGLARLADQESSLTRVGSYVGTPVYMAPECFAGQSGPQSDVYAIGGILSFLVTGRDPFDEPTPHALLAKIAAGACLPIDTPGVPQGLERVRARAMLVDRTRRYRTATHLGDDLARLQKGESVEGEPLRPRAKIAAGLVLALVAIGSGAALGRAGRHPRPVPTATPVPTFASPDEALEALARGESDAAVRSAAVKSLGLAGRSVSLAAIDSAVLRSPADPDLRRLRATQSRRSGAMIDPSDLASVASTSETPLVETVSIDALVVGLKGGLADSVGALEGARARHPSSRALGTLYALAACAAGDPSRRAQAAETLAAVRPTDEKARRLARALTHADAFAAALAGRDATRAASIGPPLLDELGPLAHENPGAASFVLAPLGPATRLAWSRGYLRDLTHMQMNEALLAALKPLLDVLPPLLRCIVAVLQDLDPRLRDAPDYFVVCEREALLRSSMAIIDADPALGAACLQMATSSRVMKLPADPGELAGVLHEIELATERNNLALKLPEGIEGSGHMWLQGVARRCASTRSDFEERLADRATDPEEVKRHRLAALDFARHQLAIDEEDIAQMFDRDAGRVVKLLWVLGRSDEGVNVYSEGPGRDALRAEHLRETGDLPAALELARATATRALPGTARTDALGALALALADKGDLEGADKAATELAISEKNAGATLDVLSSGRVREYLTAKRTRK